jgi:hypothetical protein
MYADLENLGHNVDMSRAWETVRQSIQILADENLHQACPTRRP